MIDLKFVFILVVCVCSMASSAFAQNVPSQAQALGAAQAFVQSASVQASRQEPSQPQELIQQQAQIEAQLGLELYRLGEDWRAISALQRYQLLARSQDAAYVSSLIIGQIYERNARPSLSIQSYELANQAAPSLDAKIWTSLLEIQQECMAQDLWQSCELRLRQLHEVMASQQNVGDRALREVVFAQHAVALTMLHQAPMMVPEELNTSRTLHLHVQEMERAYQAFDALPLRRPWLAATMSAVLPGTGQLYNRQWGDALIAFGLNALFASATYYSFKELESVPLGVSSAVLLSGFYVGNIVNAKTDADRYNARIYKGYFEGVKEDAWPEVSFGIMQGEVSYSASSPVSMSESSDRK